MTFLPAARLRVAWAWTRYPSPTGEIYRPNNKQTKKKQKKKSKKTTLPATERHAFTCRALSRTCRPGRGFPAPA